MSQMHRQPQGQPSAGPPGGNGQLFPTQNYLTEDVRVAVVDLLNGALADSTVLLTHAKFAHWNVKGMEFYALHQLFDEIAETVEHHIDEIAERVTSLGGQAQGTAGMAVSNCSLPSMPADAVTGQEYVGLLADRLAIHDANLYEAINTANGYGDPDTADLLNEISRDVSHYLWFLEAHLQTRPVAPSGSRGSMQEQPGASPMGQQGGQAPPPGGHQVAESQPGRKRFQPPPSRQQTQSPPPERSPGGRAY